ncbi:tripartite tricarboxylate transporter TctB family protein [Enterovirga aerilata]|uniref:Tripartite tricarboxylate transporter TctB family protein n=1 Tax=Enterovirga aerilata TaxID=2730920 RepID=A0A849ICV6_9HYPH|nr:tripartite tricarboxylate transporter TctB family protein [Enterovirga sp. DB1703]NNM71753.1 tripartite tricarboxylate transporter TctB family protein [Enterovirga sp. DB1703]
MSVDALPSAERGLSRRLVEIVVALALMGLAGLVLWDSYGRGAGWEGGPQNGYFPARVGWLLMIAAAFALISAVRARRREIFVTWEQLRQVARVFVPLLLFVLGVAYLGIYISSLLFMALFMLTVGSFRLWTVAAASVLVPLVIFWVFEIQFLVPLPKSPFVATLGF